MTGEKCEGKTKCAVRCRKRREILRLQRKQSDVQRKLLVGMKYGEWTTKGAKLFILGSKQSRCKLLGADVMAQLGLILIQKPAEQTVAVIQGEHAGQLNNINVKIEERIKKWATNKYTDLFKRTGRFNNHVVRTKFINSFEAKQQKGRRIPIALQERVATEIERLIKQGHVERLQNFTENQFISPIVITVKRVGSLKIALDSKELNKAVCKNKYQMPNIEDLMDRIAELISAKKPGKIWFSSIDLRYAYGQLQLSLKTAEQCNFALVGAEQQAHIDSEQEFMDWQTCQRNFSKRSTEF